MMRSKELKIYSHADSQILSLVSLSLRVSDCSRVQLSNAQKWHGTEITLTIEGDWRSYGSRVLKYLRQMAVITPYAEFELR